MALALESMGFSRYASTKEHSRNLLKAGSGGEPVDSLTLRKRSEVSDFKPARYVLITGEKDFSQNNNEDLKYVTNRENSDGSLVKVILISMAASEGLDFKNIRQIHILEPWYNMNRTEQILGRGVRNFSHCDVEFEDRNVEIYLHGTLLDRDEEAADLYVYRSAEKKAIQIGRVTRVIKENAVDCLLNISQTNFTEKKLWKEVANRDIHIRLSSRGEELIPFEIGDKPRTDACDYMEDCDFKCNVRPELPKIKRHIKDTYDENFIKTNSVVIMKKIRDIFREKLVYSRDHLIASINYVKKYPIEHIYYALTRFVQNKNEGLIDKYGRSGSLVSRGEYYAFQPSEIMDESISIFERGVPVDYKPVSLRMEVPKEIIPWVNEEPANELENLEPETGAEPAADVASEIVQTAVPVGQSPIKTYEEILIQIDEIFKMLADKDVTVKAIQKDWYKHANKAVPELMNIHQMKIGWIQKFVSFHYLDKLSLSEKLVIITNLYDKPGQPVGYDILLRQYFDKLLLEAQEDGEQKMAIVLADGSANKLFVKNGGRWNPSTFTDERLFTEVRKQKLIVPADNINRTEIGFMHPFKDKEIIFKTKDLTQKRNNTGAKCTDASKPSIATKIGAVLRQPSIYTATQIEKPELCVILEILMRYKSESQRIHYFFGPEKTNEMNISAFHW
jgi:hypothetical protein